ncbi:MAG TPA: RDD family protein [Candidatus Acidoferrum sp.]|nr:RDD family protein [Candidatus Acidoferrum sp.]
MANSSNSGQTGGQLDLSLWLIRLIAYIIDSIIIFVVTIILGIILAAILAAAVLSGGSVLFYGGIWLTFGLFGLLSILYFIILDVVWGATIGKRVMGLQVQNLKGGRVTFVQSIIRNISKIFWLFLFLDWLIAIVTAGPDKRQKFTDRWAGSTVVQAVKSPIVLNEPAPSSPPPSSAPPPSTPPS